MRKAKPFALPAECVIGEVDALKRALDKLIAQVDPVTLDAKDVRRIDTACLQLLTSFARERRAAGRPLAWSDVPASLVECAELLDLTAHLNLAPDTAAVPP